MCEIDEDEFIDISLYDFQDESTWLLGSPENESGEKRSIEEQLASFYKDLDDVKLSAVDILEELKTSSSSHLLLERKSSSHTAFSTNTYIKPKSDSKALEKSPDEDSLSPIASGLKLKRRLTTTITPSPNLISKLEELSKNNNRPLSAQLDNVRWEDGASTTDANAKFKSTLPPSLFKRLEELKKSNHIPDRDVKPKNNTPCRKSFDNDYQMMKIHLDLYSDNNTQMDLIEQTDSFINITEMNSIFETSSFSSLMKEFDNHDVFLNSDHVMDNLILQNEVNVSEHRSGDLLNSNSNDLVFNNVDDLNKLNEFNQTFVKSRNKRSNGSKEKISNNELNSTYHTEVRKETTFTEEYSNGSVEMDKSPKTTIGDTSVGVVNGEVHRIKAYFNNKNVNITYSSPNSTSESAVLSTDVLELSPIEKEYEISLNSPPTETNESSSLSSSSLSSRGPSPCVLDEHGNKTISKSCSNQIRSTQILRRPIMTRKVVGQVNLCAQSQSDSNGIVCRSSAIPRPASKLRQPQVRSSNITKSRGK